MSRTVISIFPSREQFLQASETLRRLPYITIEHSALMVKTEEGEATLFEDDISPAEGTLVGGTLGTMLGSLGVAALGGLLLPGVGALIAVGAGALFGGLIGGATGGIAAKLIDLGFKDADIKQVAAHLETGCVALLLQLNSADEQLIDHLQRDLAPFEANILRSSGR